MHDTGEYSISDLAEVFSVFEQTSMPIQALTKNQGARNDRRIHIENCANMFSTMPHYRPWERGLYAAWFAKYGCVAPLLM